MKRIVSLLCLLCLFVAMSSARASTNLVGSLTSITGTTNFPGVQWATLSIPEGNSFFISDGGVAATNNLTVNFQISADNTNFINALTWTPPVTNAGAYQFPAAYTNQPIFLRVQVICGATTNGVGVLTYP